MDTFIDKQNKKNSKPGKLSAQGSCFEREMLRFSKETLCISKNILAGVKCIEINLGKLKKRMDKMSDDIDLLLPKVEETNTVVDSLIVLTNGIKAKLDEALASGGGISAATKVKVKAVWDSVEAQRVEAANALLANTPQEPTEPLPEPPPPVE